MSPPPLSIGEFKRIARRAVRQLPELFQPHVAEIMLTFKRRPSRRLRRELEIPDDEDLFGYYDGVPLTEQSLNDPAALPPRIILFYEPLVEACADEAELMHEIQTTVLHEIGHHFGLDEDDLERLGFD